MAVEVIMPKQGLQMTEGKIVEWKVKEGDRVEKDQAILEIETDKLNIDVNAPDSGTILKILHKAGDVIPVAEVIAYIGAAGEKVDMSSRERTESVAESTGMIIPRAEKSAVGLTGVGGSRSVSNGRVFASPRAKWRAAEEGIDLALIEGTGPEALVIERDILAALSRENKLLDTGIARQAPATPLARKAAAVHNVELTQIAGSGAGGRITKNDVINLVAPPRGSAKTGPSQSRPTVADEGAGHLIPHTAMRKIIAKRMVESLTVAAQANHRMEADASGLRRMREALKENGLIVSYTDILIKIAAAALKMHPLMNSTWTEEGLFVKKGINVGMAIAVEGGLLVPVIHDADRLPLADIREKSRDFIEWAKSGTLKPEHMEGGTFTITNLGMYDVDSFTAIINQPEIGILAVGRIVEKPVVENGAIVIRPMVALSLTYDHRAIDGAPAAQFLQTVKSSVENPVLLL